MVDGGKARIILGVLVTAADVMENMPFLDMLWRACFRTAAYKKAYQKHNVWVEPLFGEG
jgi:hypothetical protein